jgi:hypothetical protein
MTAPAVGHEVPRVEAAEAVRRTAVRTETPAAGRRAPGSQPRPDRKDAQVISTTAREMAALDPAFKDPGRFISDRLGPPYLRSGALGPVFVAVSHAQGWAG